MNVLIVYGTEEQKRHAAETARIKDFTLRGLSLPHGNARVVTVENLPSLIGQRFDLIVLDSQALRFTSFEIASRVMDLLRLVLVREGWLLEG